MTKKSVKNPADEIAKAYDPGSAERQISALWDTAALGAATGKTASKAWAMVMPPPNVTGVLHLGHAITLTLEDVLARYHRMRGRDVLWLPGSDHAGIATQNVVERELKKQGLSRETLGREQFVAKVWEWKEKSHRRIVEQTKKMGASCDWSRERFTLDDGASQSVMHAFVKLHERGLIYRDKKLVNWCPRCTTVLSDIEVDHREEEGHLYFIRYFVNATDKSICVATTRPETMLGDTAVAVHPDDRRYAAYIGKELIVPIVNRVIRIIADKRVDPSFGTGAVKITPAHDPLDAEIGRDHNLESIVVIGPQGRMTRHAGKRFKGMALADARQAVVRYLDDIGNLERIQKHTHSVGHCSRCQTAVEPLESLQWFVRMEPLAKKALKLVEKKEIKFTPARFEGEFVRWLSEMRDWCVSRQLWWGHQLPVWYCKKVPKWENSRKKATEGCQKTIVAETTPTKCPHCGNLNLERDADVLDTWFSSGLWPFSALGWPRRTKDFQSFYPNAILETGRDILFFWVARMVMLGAELTGKSPFREVYLHGLVTDETGRKMSKSVGNVVDPLDMIGQYGTDALRLSLTVGSTPGTDLKFSESKIAGQRNFVNKLWNASRYIYGVLGGPLDAPADPRPSGLPDRWILSRLNRVAAETTASIEKHAFAEAIENLEEFVRSEFCDWYLELTKNSPNKKLLAHALSVILRLAHPFIPFVTEAIWGYYHAKARKPKLLAQEKWPNPIKARIDDKVEAEVRPLLTVISAIRSVRAELGVEPAKLVAATIHAGSAEANLKKQATEIKKLARLSRLTIKKTGKKVPNAVAKFEGDLEIYLPLAKLINPKEEKKRLTEDLQKSKEYEKIVSAKLSTGGFAKHAPREIVAVEQAKLAEVQEKIAKIEERLKTLKSVK